MSNKPLQVVLDTNCLISALIFSRGKTSILRTTWKKGDIVPIVCKQTVTELLRVLAYPKFNLSPAEIEVLLADFLPWTKAHILLQPVQTISELRDPDDAVFIQLARETKTVYLVSGDKHLLELKHIIHNIEIVSVTEFTEKVLSL